MNGQKVLRRPDAARWFRAAALDVAHSRRRSMVLTGPLELPGVDELIHRHNAFGAHGPATRICLQPAVDDRLWRIRPVDGSGAVTSVPAPPGADPTVLFPMMRELRARGPRLGIHILHAGEWLMIEFCHGLGEAALINALLDALLGVTDPTAPDFAESYRHIFPPLLRAGWRVAATAPRRIGPLLGLHRRRPRPDAPAPNLTAFVPSPATRVVGWPAEMVDDLRKRRNYALPGVSLTALCTYALWNSLRRTGLEVHPTVKIPFDARRYLRPGPSTLAPFSAGLDFSVDAGPVALQRDMVESVRAGRPVVNLLVSTIKARLVPTGPARHRPDRPRIRLLHSNVLRGARTDRWPFTDHAAARVLVASEPAGADGLTVTSAWSGGNLWFTAEFHDTVFDADRIDLALRQLADEVAAILTRCGRVAPGGGSTR